MNRFFLLILLLGLFYSSKAFHIVGGEMSFETIAPGTYRITLVQYYDEAQTLNNTYDQSANVHIFSNRDNSRKVVINLPRASISNVAYTNIKCVIDQLKTSKVVFSAVFNLNPEEFADEAGYYLSWERCCRNVSISNIVNPTGAGMNYIVEIPPLWKDGAPYINSSPTLFRPLGDYACINQLYYVNFIGIDPDGDSLSYKMATPLNSSATFPAAPTPQPKPHIPVAYRSGFSKDVSIKGSIPLKINSTGLLSVNPSETGLFVFSVIVEEWREGSKIGEVQRDFQMLVVDGCEPPIPPKVGIKIPGNPDFSPSEDVLSYSVTDEKCFEYLVTNISAGEEINLRAELVGFEEELEDVFEITSAFIDPDQDTLLVQVCAPDCPPVRGKPFAIDLIASDDACPLPQLDTLRLTLAIEPPPNQFPTITPGDNSFYVNENELFSLDISGFDADSDTMDMFLVVDGVEDPSTIGFSLAIANSEAGRIDGTINWDTDCLSYDFNEDQQYHVRVLVDDRDSCMAMNPDYLFLDMHVVLPPNTAPKVGTTGMLSYEVVPNEVITFEVNVVDDDGDSVTLAMLTPDLDAAVLGLAFNDTKGLGSAAGTFSWELDCTTAFASGKENFELFFVGEDLDVCKENNQDTLKINIHVNYPDNIPPDFESYGKYRIRVNETFSLELKANDGNAEDSLYMRFYDGAFRPNSSGLSFPEGKGQGSVSSVFTWTPACDLLDQGETSAFFELVFEVYDNGCPTPAGDTIHISFELFDDRISFEDFNPPNAFSPNGDGMNDQFTLVGLREINMNLPGDNCQNSFEYVSIHDRNGKSVYHTDQRDFTWTGDNLPSGVYYYVVKYSEKEYKGHLNLLR